ncbi:MAG: cytosine permease [Desulfurococcaceae archaeon]
MNEIQELKPISSNNRLYGVITFSWMMFSMNVCIPLFFLGTIGYNLGLNPLEVVLGALLGNLATVVVMILNGVPGVKYGIPYPIQLRPSWGLKGSHIPVILRGIVGAGWYGIEAYSASLAILMIILAITSHGKMEPSIIVQNSFKYVVFVVALYVVLASIVVAKGLKTIAKVVNISGPFLLLYFIWLTIYLAGRNNVNTSIPSGVGLLSKEFALYLAVQTNFWATVALNISDLSRGLFADKRGYKALVVGPLVGIVLTSTIASVLGYYMSLYTGYSTPQEIILYAAPGVIAMILGQIFAFLAPFSTDVTANIPALMNLLVYSLKIRKYKLLLAAIIGFILAPWWAVEKGPDVVSYVTAFTANYGILLGPIAGIMIADYYLVRGRNYNFNELHEDNCYGYKCFNYAAILTYVLSIIGIYLFSFAVNDVTTVGPLVFPTSISWYLGVILSTVFYPLLMKIFK